MGGGRVGGRDPEPSQVIYPAPSLVGQWTSNGLCVCLCVVLLCREVVSVVVWLGLVGWAGPARTRGNCRKQQKTGEPTTRGCGGRLWWGAVVGGCGVTLYYTVPPFYSPHPTHGHTRTQLKNSSGSHSRSYWAGDQVPGLHAGPRPKPRPHTPTRANEHRVIVYGKLYLYA